MNGLLEELQRYMSISHRGIAGDRPRSLSRGPTGLRRPAMHERHKSSWKHPASVVRSGPTRELFLREHEVLNHRKRERTWLEIQYCGAVCSCLTNSLIP